jgi:hypothetical protein
MNNEPVAWMSNGKEFYVQKNYCPDFIPLYTHPAKTLTDEEIEQVRVAIMGAAYWCADENMSEAYNAVKVCCSKVLEILRKAQEK